jgi:hypothetical protein
VLLGEVLAIVFKEKKTIIDSNNRFRSSGVIRILEKFRDNVARALDLFE